MPYENPNPTNLNGLSERRLRAIRALYHDVQANFISSVLNDNRARIIDETSALILRSEGVSVREEDIEALGVDDYCICAEIEFMYLELPGDLEAYDKYHVTGEDPATLLRNQRQYLELDAFWVGEEFELLRRKYGRNPTIQELQEDARVFKTPLRFRAYYCKKFPDRMKEDGQSP